MKFQPQKSGFTLVELLVVICIIAILAALSISGLKMARTYAEKTACSSNLRQIGAALFAYAADHDGVLPESGGTVTHGQVDQDTGLPGWTEQLEPYVGTDLKVYRCPSSSNVFSKNKTYSYFQGGHPAYVAAGGKSAAVRLAMISMPSVTIMGGDIASNMFVADDTDKDDFTQSPAFPANAKVHGGVSNILFYDGHVAAFSAYDKNAMAVRYEGTGYDYP